MSALSTMDASYDVIIVGFGPSGAVAAGLLGQAGIKTLVVDRLHQVYDKPRAIALDHEIMRVFQQLGVAEQVAEYIEPFTPSEYYGADGALIKRLATVEPPFPLGYTPSMVFTQPPVERILRARVQALPSVTVVTGVEFIGEQQDGTGVRVQLRHEDGGVKEVPAQYLIGCDGASSAVRAAAGIELEDLDFDEPWLVVDVLVNEKGLAKLPETSVQFCEPERPCTYVIGPNNHRRWEISLLPGEDPRHMATEEGAWSVLKRWITPDDATLWRQASYRFHALVAKQWRQGRIFIAGDAAHQQPPFLGQGMCQGVRDVANLSWKLQAVLQHHAPVSLLDSYGEERGLHVRKLTGRIKDIGKLICERDLAAARSRDARLIAEAGGTIKTVARQDIIPPLEAGLLSTQSTSARGSLFPQPRVVSSEGNLLLDQIAGNGWRLVFDAGKINVTPALIAAARQFDAQIVAVHADALRAESGVLRVQEQEQVLANWFSRHGVSAALVRPDNYVYGVAKTADGLLMQIASLLPALTAGVAIAA